MKKILLLVSILFCSTTLFANTINNIIFFGDSLTDNGNLHRYMPFMPKSPPYYAGRFSNGPVWSDNLSASLGQKYHVSSDNFAVGGATTVFHNPFEGILPLKISEEIADYHLRTLGHDRSHVLFVIWIGANDYISEKSGTPEGISDEVVNEVAANIQTLSRYGARNFLLLDLPDITKTPRGQKADPNLATRYRTMSALNHAKIARLVANLRAQHRDYFVGYVDVYDLFNDILTNTQKYNQQYNLHINNTKDACWGGGYTLQNRMLPNEQMTSASIANEIAQNPLMKQVNPQDASAFIMNSPSLQTAYEVGQLQALGATPCQDPDSYIFWDQVHPTRVAHKIIAAVIESYLVSQGVVGH